LTPVHPPEPLAAAIFYVLRRIAQEIDAGQETEQRQHGESARLHERERLFREVHQPVLAVLDAIASGAAPEAELSARARAEAAALRRAFDGSRQALADGLQAQVASLIESLIKEHAGNGWTVRLVDEEMTVEPRPAVAAALRDAIAGLLEAATATPGPGQIRIRIQCDDGGTSVVVRVTGCGQFADAALGRARACLAGVAGSASLAPALHGEDRVVLWVPP
jgi:hypothetical protein